ncbi:hypothetical protein SK128_025708 [Halocaridina rubra]|uniref:Uncharacterized protein n=1 Tax=Halocaridina rubra TaxID=373956 RepID=A0AAN9AD71_HALRR
MAKDVNCSSFEILVTLIIDLQDNVLFCCDAAAYFFFLVFFEGEDGINRELDVWRKYGAKKKVILRQKAG